MEIIGHDMDVVQHTGKQTNNKCKIPAVLCTTDVRACNICTYLLMHLRSNLGNLVCRVNGSLSSSDSSSQHQTGTVGPLALLFEGAHQLLQTREERDTATVFRIIAYFYTDKVLLILTLTLRA